VADPLSLSDGDTILSWSDIEGFANLSGSATYRDSRLNGHATAEFDGTNDGLKGAGSSSEAQPNTFFIVARITGDGDSSYSLIDTHRGGSGRQSFLWSSGSQQYAAFAGLFSRFGGSLNSDFHIYTIEFNGNSSFLRIDGSLIGSADPGTLSLDGIALGFTPGGSSYLEGDIAEVVGASASLSSTTISDEEQRLANQYNITL
jgi:hypothetical protein